jgi:hypothetical protein
MKERDAMNPELLLRLTRSLVVAFILAGLVTCLPGLRRIQVAEAAGAPLPLPGYTEAAALAAQDPFGGCIDPTRIVQRCSLASLPGIRPLEQQVIADLIDIHRLPPGVASLPVASGRPGPPGPSDTASRLLSWERDTLRTLLFDKIAVVINKEPTARTREEQAIVDALATLVQEQRLAAAMEAKRFYNRWQADPCTFEPPPGLSYARPTDCAIPNAISGIFNNPPSVEQFQAYGAYVASQRFSTDADVQAAAANAAKMYGFLGGLYAAGIASLTAYTFATGTALGTSIATAISPFGGVVVGTAASAGTVAGAAGGAGAGSVAVGAAGLAVAALIVVIALVVAGIAAYTVITASEIPGKLDAAIEAARTPPDLKVLLASDTGKQEIFAAYLPTTVPPANAPTVLGGLTGWSPVPAARPDDAKFLIDPGPGQQESAELVFRSWDRPGRVRLSQGWFVDENAPGGPAMTLHIDYRNGANEQWTAWRIGDRFLHTTAGNVKPSFVSDTIQYQDTDAALPRTARIQAGGTVTGPVTTGPDIVAPVVNPPAFAGTPADVTVDQDSGYGSSVTFPTPSATDAATVACEPASGSTFPVGQTTVTCTATSPIGARATTSFTVTVRPWESPHSR